MPLVLVLWHISSFFFKPILLKLCINLKQDRLYYVALNAHPSAQSQRHFFTIDNEMIYWNFYLDFGPLNLGHVYRFCILMNKKLNDPKLKDKIIFYYSSEHPHKRTNAAFLISAWAMLCLNKSPEDAFKPFRSFHLSFPPWVSESTGASSKLSIHNFRNILLI